VISTSPDIDELQASLLRSLASKNRLRILHLLADRPREVNELARELGLSQAAMSQHLGAMRRAGLVESLPDGRVHRYQVADPQIIAACGLMRSVLVRRLAQLGKLAAAAVESGSPKSPTTAEARHE
jgi:DNA-binding transcriptional ArsR family regulator